MTLKPFDRRAKDVGILTMVVTELELGHAQRTFMMPLPCGYPGLFRYSATIAARTASAAELIGGTPSTA